MASKTVCLVEQPDNVDVCARTVHIVCETLLHTRLKQNQQQAFVVRKFTQRCIRLFERAKKCETSTTRVVYTQVAAPDWTLQVWPLGHWYGKHILL